MITTVDLSAAVPGRPSIDAIWAALAAIPDPEIPVISIVDLGIVRRVAWSGDELRVAITPTYSGCPATTMIRRDIVSALGAHGLDRAFPFSCEQAAR